VLSQLSIELDRGFESLKWSRSWWIESVKSLRILTMTHNPGGKSIDRVYKGDEH
jgi:hypothetical protein